MHGYPTYREMIDAKNNPIHLAFPFLPPLIGLARTAGDAPAGAKQTTYKGAYFEIKYPADFKARAIDATKAKESSAATFSSPDGDMEFYIFSPQWGGDAPGIALDPSRETETRRKTDKGKSSGVAGVYSWVTISARDKSHTRVYQDFLAEDASIHWVIGMKYKSDAA
ncbi:MAG: hypothetical protein LH481_13325 [Burkholderiales bacterium]|nr:hypothetical protein [Burkholderiales bacterium]